MPRIDEAGGRSLSVIYPEELPYREALEQRKLKLQRRRSRLKGRLAIRASCPHHSSFDLERVPYALVQFAPEEAHRLTTTLLDSSADIRRGLARRSCLRKGGGEYYAAAVAAREGALRS